MFNNYWIPTYYLLGTLRIQWWTNRPLMNLICWYPGENTWLLGKENWKIILLAWHPCSRVQEKPYNVETGGSFQPARQIQLWIYQLWGHWLAPPHRSYEIIEGLNMVASGLGSQNHSIFLPSDRLVKRRQPVSIFFGQWRSKHRQKQSHCLRPGRPAAQPCARSSPLHWSWPQIPDSPGQLFDPWQVT